MSDARAAETRRRRTFAIISHPDAGKTTLTEKLLLFGGAIQSEVACFAALRDFTEPAIWIAPPNSSSFSVSVVLPASGWEMIANVRRRAVSVAWVLIGLPKRMGPGEDTADGTIIARRHSRHPSVIPRHRSVIPAKAGIHRADAENGFPLSRE